VIFVETERGRRRVARSVRLYASTLDAGIAKGSAKSTALLGKFAQAATRPPRYIRRALKIALAILSLLTVSLVLPLARADGRVPVVVWPTLTPAGDSPSGGALHRPRTTEKELHELAHQLDSTLRDAVQDLGFALSVADDEPSPLSTRDDSILDRASRSAIGEIADDGTWVISPRIEHADHEMFIVRIVAAAPRAHELRVRVQTVSSDSVSVRGLTMLRDLLSPETAAQASAEDRHELTAHGSAQGIARPIRSAGRAILAVNAAMLGGFTAYALQTASGSDDPRVLYPLLAVGTGMGLGGALLVADEWDVTAGDAWTLSAGSWWGATAGYLLASGHGVRPMEDRFSWASGGGLIGIGLATFALTQAPMDDGDATLVHSGAALGLLFGGASEWLARGSTTNLADFAPNTGMGVGTAVGLVGAGLLATRVEMSPSRIVLIDVGVGGGALLGAAAASPLIFNNQRESAVRGWLAASLTCGILGGGAAWWLTREPPAAPSKSALRSLFEGLQVGVVGTSSSRSRDVPVLGIGWRSEN